MRLHKNITLIHLVLTVLLTVLLYTNGSHRGINYGDGQDLLLAAAGNGLAHPPGYPLLINIYRGLHLLFPLLSWGELGTLVSAVSMATATGVTGLLIRRHVLSHSLPAWQKLLLSWGVIIGWIVAPHIWLFGLIPEIMPFTLLLISLFIYSLTTKRSVLIGILASSLVLFHALTVGIVLVLLAVWIYSKKQIPFQLVLGFILGCVITIVNYALLTHPTSYGWQPPTNVNGWWQFWLRSGYDASSSAVDMYGRDWNVYRMFQSIVFWWSWLATEVRPWILVLALFGLISLKKNNLVQVASLGILLIYGIGVPAYLKNPQLYAQSELAVWYGIGLRERMMYPIFVILLFFAATGMSVLVKVGIKKWGLLAGLVTAIIIFTAGCISLYQDGYAGGNINANNASAVYANAVLTPLPADSILLVDSDEIFNLLYAQQIAGIRPDLYIVSVNMALTPDWYATNKWMRSSNHDSKEAFVADVVSWNLYQNRRVFLYHFDETLIRYLGLEGNPFYAVPFGYTLEVAKVSPQKLDAHDYGVSVQVASMTNANSDNWFKYTQASLAYIHTQLAYYAARIGAVELAQFHTEQASALSYYQSTKDQIIQVAAIGHKQYTEQGNYLAIPPQTAAWWLAAGESNYFSSRARLLDPYLSVSTR